MAASVDFDEVDDTELVEEDILKVMQEVATLRNCADDLGLALCLSPSFCVKGVDLKAVILEWLKGEVVSPSPACWRTLVKAVAHPVGGKNKALARRIASKHLQKKVSSPVTVSESGQMQQQQQQGGSYPYPVTVTGPKQEEQKTGSHGAKLVYPKQPTPSVTPSVATGATLSSAGLPQAQQISHAVQESGGLPQAQQISHAVQESGDFSSSSDSSLPRSSLNNSSISRSSSDKKYRGPYSDTGDETSNMPTAPGVNSDDEEQNDVDFDHDEEQQHLTLENPGVKVAVGRGTQSDSFSSLFSSLKQQIKGRRKATLEEFMSPYNINSPPAKHGCAIIINIIQCPRLPKRDGGEKDEENLKRVFKELRYDVQVSTNMVKGEFERLSNQVQAANYRECDSFVCCFLSHGTIDDKGQEVFLLTDGTHITIDVLKQMAVTNETLVGKPKLFFIQACRGKDMIDARKLRSDGPEMCLATKDYYHPYHSDVFVGYPTTRGTQACRDGCDFADGVIKVQAGSWYITELCFVLASLHQTHDLLSMMTIVHNILARDERYDRDLVKADERHYRQAAQMESTLIRPFFFESNQPIAPNSRS